MQELEEYIAYNHLLYLKQKLATYENYIKANFLLREITGISSFFESQDAYSFFLQFLKKSIARVRDSERREFGDFQTPEELTDIICLQLNNNDLFPQSVIEPTFGKGSFIISSLKHFDSITSIFGIEIYDKYVWIAKFKLLEYFLENPQKTRPDIYLFKQDIFYFDFQKIKDLILDSVLVLGNPPWITNSELSTLNSRNLPNKSNLKRLKGIDAITGKGNFDIGEFISLLMLNNFSNFNGKMAFLIKNSVIKNLVQDLGKFNFNISNIKTYKIDAKSYFNASVGASLFTCDFNQPSDEFVCESFENISSNSPSIKFGWYKDKFISDINAYKNTSKYDGYSPYEWRQGVKHDSSKVFELTKNDDHYLNGLHEEIDIENDLVYGLIKSSDLKNDVVSQPRKYVIVTQRFIGEDTAYIKQDYPKLYLYLHKHEDLLNNRKSSIYKNKPSFSIFGIGKYSFKPYKIAISGLYKYPRFSLVLPEENGKCLMLDDTCYFLSFEKLEPALFTWCILTDRHVHDLLKAISFLDAKRPYTKDILMRISIDRLAFEKDFDEIYDKILKLEIGRPLTINHGKWIDYLNSFDKSINATKQATLF